jgi:polyhydroxyalkanoate synthesis regulator phasin
VDNPWRLEWHEVVNIINQQQQQIKQMSEKIQELETNTTVRKTHNEAFDPTLYQKKITELEKKVADLEKEEGLVYRSKFSHHP